MVGSVVSELSMEICKKKKKTDFTFCRQRVKLLQLSSVTQSSLNINDQTLKGTGMNFSVMGSCNLVW